MQLLALCIPQDPAGLDVVEKYGVLGLLYIVLGAIGVFLIKKGDKLVTSIEANTAATMQHTAAVRDLTNGIGNLIRQHDEEARRAKEQIDNNTATIMEAVKEGFASVKDEVRRGPGKP